MTYRHREGFFEGKVEVVIHDKAPNIDVVCHDGGKISGVGSTP
jgi:hypothetical protein